jgi:hypothetical protein
MRTLVSALAIVAIALGTAAGPAAAVTTAREAPHAATGKVAMAADGRAVVSAAATIGSGMSRQVLGPNGRPG